MRFGEEKCKGGGGLFLVAILPVAVPIPMPPRSRSSWRARRRTVRRPARCRPRRRSPGCRPAAARPSRRHSAVNRADREATADSACSPPRRTRAQSRSRPGIPVAWYLPNQHAAEARSVLQNTQFHLCNGGRYAAQRIDFIRYRKQVPSTPSFCLPPES